MDKKDPARLVWPTTGCRCSEKMMRERCRSSLSGKGPRKDLWAPNVPFDDRVEYTPPLLPGCMSCLAVLGLPTTIVAALTGLTLIVQDGGSAMAGWVVLLTLADVFLVSSLACGLGTVKPSRVPPLLLAMAILGALTLVGLAGLIVLFFLCINRP